MKRMQVCLTEEQHRRLKRLADVRGTTISELIREAITEHVARHLAEQDPLLDIIGLGESGFTDGSIHHDRDL